MTHRLINWLLAILIVALYAGMSLLDGPTDHQYEHAQALSMRDAIRDEQSQVRFQKVAKKLCGNELAVVKFLDSKTVQCLTRMGHQTKVSAL